MGPIESHNVNYRMMGCLITLKPLSNEYIDMITDHHHTHSHERKKARAHKHKHKHNTHTQIVTAISCLHNGLLSFSDAVVQVVAQSRYSQPWPFRSRQCHVLCEQRVTEVSTRTLRRHLYI